LYRTSDLGGAPTAITALDPSQNELLHTQPFFLPDGRHLLYLAIGSNAGTTLPATLYAASLNSSEKPTALMPTASSAQYADGYLFYLRGSTLTAQAFDAERLRIAGEPISLGEQIDIAGNIGAGAFSVSQPGVVYQASARAAQSQLVWHDRSGRRLATIGQPADQVSFELSPDDRHAVASLFDPVNNSRDLWVYDSQRGERNRLTSDAADELSMVWSPDGSQITYGSTRKGRLNLYRRPADGSGEEELLLEDVRNKYPYSWSPDGRLLLYSTGATGSATGNDIWVLSTPDRQTRPFLDTKFYEGRPYFSPDGRWVAYESGDTGATEIYVISFPGRAGRRRVSDGGGTQPRWRRDGRELFFLDAKKKLMAVSVRIEGDVLETGPARVLFETRVQDAPYRSFGGIKSYSVSADGQRFLINTISEEGTPSALTLLLNWKAAVR